MVSDIALEIQHGLIDTLLTTYSYIKELEVSPLGPLTHVYIHSCRFPPSSIAYLLPRLFLVPLLAVCLCYIFPVHDFLLSLMHTPFFTLILQFLSTAGCTEGGRGRPKGQLCLSMQILQLL